MKAKLNLYEHILKRAAMRITLQKEKRQSNAGEVTVVEGDFWYLDWEIL